MIHAKRISNVSKTLAASLVLVVGYAAIFSLAANHILLLSAIMCGLQMEYVLLLMTEAYGRCEKWTCWKMQIIFEE